ncbi:hypothetical protein QCQ60_005139 [Bacillus cereus]|nr:hypothetical protein [Bacillus cereus]
MTDNLTVVIEKPVLKNEYIIIKDDITGEQKGGNAYNLDNKYRVVLFETSYRAMGIVDETKKDGIYSFIKEYVNHNIFSNMVINVLINGKILKRKIVKYENRLAVRHNNEIYELGQFANGLYQVREQLTTNKWDAVWTLQKTVDVRMSHMSELSLFDKNLVMIQFSDIQKSYTNNKVEFSEIDNVSCERLAEWIDHAKETLYICKK